MQTSNNRMKGGANETNLPRKLSTLALERVLLRQQQKIRNQNDEQKIKIESLEQQIRNIAQANGRDIEATAQTAPSNESSKFDLGDDNDRLSNSRFESFQDNWAETNVSDQHESERATIERLQQLESIIEKMEKSMDELEAVHQTDKKTIKKERSNKKKRKKKKKKNMKKLGIVNNAGEEIGLALPGGSMRAATCGMSVLRGFQQQIVTNIRGEKIPAMEMIRYNSGISGGSIPAVLYSYAQVPVDQLLETCRTRDPSKITSRALQHMPKTSMGYGIAEKPRQRLKILTTALKMLLLPPTNIFKVHALWTAVIYNRTLKPFHMPRNKYFTSGLEELEKILAENPNLSREQFFLPRDDVKTLPMILFTMIGSSGNAVKDMRKWVKLQEEVWAEYKAQESLNLVTTNKLPNMTDVIVSKRDQKESGVRSRFIPVPFVATPDYIETRYRGKLRLKNKDVDFPPKPVPPYKWGDKGMFGTKRFTIEFLTGISTNFVAMAIARPAQLVNNVRKIKMDDDRIVKQAFADGGWSDLTGIMPLVQHKVKNIIVPYAYNKSEPYSKLEGTYADIHRHAYSTSLSDPAFDTHFKYWLRRISPQLTCFFGFFGLCNITQANILAHIFDDPGLGRLKELMIKLNSLFQAGEPLIATLKDLKVLENPFWGIPGDDGQTVNLTIMYFNMPKKFAEQVPIDLVTPPKGMPKIDKDGRFNNPAMRSIPELPTSGTSAIHYTNEQVNMMGYLGSWMVNHSWNGLRGHDGALVFEGFSEIFEKMPDEESKVAYAEC